MVKGTGKKTTDVIAAVEASYAENVTDEFILPIVHTDAAGNPLAVIQPDDVVICFNFRTDRCRQITRVLTQEDFPDLGMFTLPLHYVTMTRYDHTFKNVSVIFENDDLNKTLGEILSLNNKRQIRIAETEKYPHVSFFFSGGREYEFDGEKRIVAASPKVATYDLQPEMSAYEVKDKIVAAINNDEADFICLNFANADMVGHTGVFSACIKACEAVDTCVGEVIAAALQHNFAIILTADHGNSDFEINADGSPNTQHSTNPVPVFYIDNAPQFTKLKNGKLGDVAPTILTLMGLPIPAEMTGDILVS